jgi:hypothetical protein
MRGLMLVAAIGLGAVTRPCAGHPGFPASANVQVDAAGEVVMHVRHDALALALNETPANIGDWPMLELLHGPREGLIRALDKGRERFSSMTQVNADGRPVELQVSDWPRIEAIDAAASGGDRIRLPLMLDFVAQGRLPAGAKSMTLRFPEVMGEVVLIVERPGMEPFSLPLRAGEESPAIALSAASGADAPGAQSASSNDEERDSAARPPPSEAAATQDEAPAVSTWNVAWRYVVLGFEHIVPYGADHVLFVLGLFFLSTSLRALLVQVTAFTIAHSVTLTLAVLDIVRLPSEVVEPIIAGSIAFVAIENLLTTRVHPWRLAIVFVFGLVHGMGFAGVLLDLGLPKDHIAVPLISFNVGVELGQLAVVAGAFALVGWWRKRKWYRRAIAMPASALIACAGLWWMVQRLAGW